MGSAESEGDRHLEAAGRELARWLKSIPQSSIVDLKKRLEEVDRDCKEGLPANLAAAIESGEAKEEVKAALGVDKLDTLSTQKFAQALNRRHVGRRANDRQLAEIRARGTFEDGGDINKNQPDVWRVSRLLQTGCEVRTRWYYTLLVVALDQIWVQPRHRLSKERGLSVAAGLRNIWTGLTGVANGIVGIRLEDFDSAAAAQDVQRDRKAFCVERGGASLDPRLFDDKTRAFLSKSWKRIASDRASAWANREESAFVKEAIERVRSRHASQEGSSESSLLSGTPDAEISAEVRALSRAEEARRLAAAVANDPGIEEHSPGLGPVLAQYVEAAWALSAQVSDLQDKEQKEQIAQLTALQTKHPVLVNLSHWKEAKLQRALANWRSALQWRPLEEAESVLSGIGEAEARLAAADATWRREKLRALKANGRVSRKYRVPRFKATAFVRIWNSQHFWVDCTVPGSSSLASWRVHEPPRQPDHYWDIETGRCDPGRQAQYTLRKYDVLETAPNGPFWRFQLMAQRTVKNFKNGVCYFASGLWTGPLGLRALFALRAFAVNGLSVDSVTGRVYQKTDRTQPTFVSRLGSLWGHVSRSRQQFEAEPSAGLIGKSIARPFNLVWNYLVKGALGTALLCAFIPFATSLTVAVCAGVIVTSPLWAPAWALMKYIWDLLIWDEMTGEYFPVIAALFWDIGVTGVLNIPVSLISFIVHPVIGAVVYVVGTLLLAVVAAWDWIMFWGLLRWHARIPASDTFLCRRIGGAGIGETYFVQVAPAAVLLALRLELQKHLLDAHLDALIWDANAPVRAATKVQSLLHNLGFVVALPTGTTAGRPGNKVEKVVQRAQMLEGDIRLAMSARVRALGTDAGSRQFEARGMVRLSRDDLDRTLPIAEDMVRRFILDQLLPVRSKIGSGSSAAAELWKAHGLTEDDWAGLTRKLLAGAVADGVLTPLEDDARGIALQVDHVTPKEYVSMLISNSVHDDLEVAHVIEPQSKTAGAAALRWRDAHSGRMICGLRTGAFSEDSIQIWPVDEMDGLLDDLAAFTPAGRIGFA